MKKFIFIFSVLILVFAFAVIILQTNLPTIASYVMGKFINGEAHISRADITYKAGTIIVDFGDTRVKGNIEGQAKTWQLVIGIAKGLHLEHVTISDFDISVLETKGKARFFPVPHDLFEIKRGVVTYNKQRFIVDEVKIKNLRAKKPFTFEIIIRNDDLFGTLNASGEGHYKGSATDMKGRLSVASLNLDKFSNDMRGNVHSQGTFTYAKKRFVYEGPFELFGYMLKDTTFRKPFYVEKATGDVSFVYADTRMDINIRHTYFKNTPLALNLKFEKGDLSILELSSDFFDIQDIKDNIALEGITKTEYDIGNRILSGNIRIKKFVYDKKNPIYAELELKNTEISYQDIHVADVESMLSFDDKKMTISGAKGLFKTSTFYNVAGIIPFSKERGINIKGNYSFNLKDIPSILNVGEMNFKNGEAEGTIELTGNKDRGHRIDGTGKLTNADVTWRKLSVSAKGVYKFNNNGIVFDPLIINKGGTDMVIKGRWNKKIMDIKMKGDLDADHIKPFISIPFNLGGIANLDMKVQKDDSSMKVDGDISMDNIFFEIPGTVRKDKGIKSKASLIILKEGTSTRIERLLYNLDIINIDLKGDVRADKKII